jgi:hypothetical protein
MNQTIKLIGAVTAVFISAIAATKINFSGDQSKLDRIKVREGFKIEHLHSPSDAKQGSWVSLTFHIRSVRFIVQNDSSSNWFVKSLF